MKINKAAGAAILAVATAGSLFTAVSGGSASASVPAATRQPAAPALSGVVKINKSTNLVNGEKVTVTASNFPDMTDAPILYVTECASPAILHENPTYCDTVPAHSTKITNTGTTPGSGGGTGVYTIRTGSNFAPTNPKGACDNLHRSCFLIVADGATNATTKNVGFTTITLKDTRVATTTKLAGAKSAKIGSKVTIRATTKHGKTAPTGTVTFKDGSKKLATVKETKTGKVTLKIKIAKGVNKITAVYSGDVNYKASKGKATVTGKKK